MKACQLLKKKGDPYILQEEVIELTNQFYVTLRAYFAKIKQDGNIRNQQAFQQIEELLKPDTPHNWTNAYEIEQLLVHLFEDDTLAAELKIRLLEARSVLHKELVDSYDEQVRDIEKPFGSADQNGRAAEQVNEQRRTLLGRLVNDLQWRYVVNEARRRYSKFITNRTAWLFGSFLLLFVGVIVVITFFGVEFKYGDLWLLPVAALAGAWGATFSLLVTLRGRLDSSKFDDLKLMRHRAVLYSRALIGAGAASILYFFLLSGLLGGTAFPTLTRPEAGTVAQGTQQAAPPTTPSGAPPAPQGAAAPATPPAPATTSASDVLSPRNLALLIVWCFIAGFSEQLIPGLLASTEARANGTSPDRSGPNAAGPVVPPANSAQAKVNANGATVAASNSDKPEDATTPNTT